ncbi:siderophore ABC transporter substrate-binding protein [Lachnoclostridium phytofermentans]|uniref:Periplasmic binding protein n=1 Tax=Lachnoclostridium phytofermentans (strain ATCC 700394 / DSM 18823 / ISDg) TaxID=357809 RepID=A9KJW6_LACP7|nr:ABC transporter substrate-binding protein [Lachnoclostridium phytofermentans]ABX41121.1 periplasmic binding protein [Lachnoclostridium phytofermentans ISDg]
MKKFSFNKSIFSGAKKKVLAGILLGVMATSVLTGCAKKQGDTPENNANKGEESATTATPAPTPTTAAEETRFSLTHPLGTVTLEGAAKKVVVFDMGALDTIDALSFDGELAVPHGNIPTYLSKYEESTVNAGGLFEPDMEAIFTFEPDVIIIGGRQVDFYDELNEIAPTIYVEINADTYMEDFKRNTDNIAKAIGKENEAKTAIDGIMNKVEEVKQITNSSDKKGLIIMTNDGSISAYGLGSRFGLIHDVLEVKPADETIEVSKHGMDASYEYIAKVDPDILFVVDRTVIAGGSTTAEKTLDNELVLGTKAAKNNVIISLDSECWYLSSGGINSMQVMVKEVEGAFNK